MAAFIRRLVDHLLNQVLVEGLANSKTFQKFAVWSHKTAKELGEKGKQANLDQHVTKVSEVLKQRGAQFRKEFEQEFRKIQEQQQQQQQQRGKK